MSEVNIGIPELPNLVTLLAAQTKDPGLAKFLYLWENVIFSLLIIFLISLIAYLGSRKRKLIPENRLQGACEFIAGALDDFICGILGPQGRIYTPFLGTLFIYIIVMNLSGIIPFLKPPTASLSTTFGLAIIVFAYVQFTAIKEMGFLGYLDHLAGRPRGVMAFTVFIPLLMFVLHLITELIRPITLSLRLRSNIWGDDLLIAVIAGLGLGWVPLLFFNMLIAILKAVVQAGVFCLLATVYFALVLTHEEEHKGEPSPNM